MSSRIGFGCFPLFFGRGVQPPKKSSDGASSAPVAPNVEHARPAPHSPSAGKASFRRLTSHSSISRKGSEAASSSAQFPKAVPLHLAYPLVGLNLAMFAEEFDILGNAGCNLAEDADKFTRLKSLVEPIGLEHILAVPIHRREALRAKFDELQERVKRYEISPL